MFLNLDGSVWGSNQVGDFLWFDDFFGFDLFEVFIGSVFDFGDFGIWFYCVEMQVCVMFVNWVVFSSVCFFVLVQVQVWVCSGQGDLGILLFDVIVLVILIFEVGGLCFSVSLSGVFWGYLILGQFIFVCNDGKCGLFLFGSENVFVLCIFECLDLMVCGLLLWNVLDDLMLVLVVYFYDDDGVMVVKNLDVLFVCVGGSIGDGEDE